MGDRPGPAKPGASASASRAAPPAFPDGSVRGPVLRPADGERYAEEAAGFQAGYRHRPDVIVGAAGAADVAAAVEYAAGHSLPLAVQATGHGLTEPLGGGVLVSTRRMAEVRIDAAARRARVGAGVRWGAVVDEAARHGLAPLSGSGPGVGAVSYTLNGGVGLLAREFGYAADHVHSAEVVTADGRVRRVTADSDPELFWALRGGGCGFGVVTELEIGLVPVERIYGGRLVFDGAHAEDVLECWQEWTATVPETLTSSVTMTSFPDAPGMPDAVRGRYLAQVQIACRAEESEAERLVAPLRSAGPRVTETLRTMPYTDSASVYDEPDQPHHYLGGNALLGRRLPDRAALRPALQLTGPEVPAVTVLGLRHMAGALSRQPQVSNAVAGRDAGYLLVVLSVPDGGGDGDPGGGGAGKTTGPAELRSLQQRVLDSVAGWTVGANANFRYGRSAAAPRGGAEAGRSPEERRRLAAVKEAVDPGDLFRFHPGAAEGTPCP